MSLTNGKKSEFNNITENNLNRIHNTVSKVGYSDGITDGRESVFQNGFDTGYENGLATGFELAKYKAFYEVMNKSTSASENLKSEADIYDHLEIPIPTDKSHFMGNGEEVSSLSQQQKNYLNEKTTLFAKDLPIATNLFSR
ncbi:uncharacterized protein LOC129914580 [Episyrphus balteatus]|uniref:uncharacterized protein LOC129914580 n=1 Tax=Episyrphus balteatus TaxID=286459 RepID=UPI0024865D45|nr:uncharacterized protein LOC129914580 [Episyrphus balteatus]